MGYSESELDNIQARWKFRFPADLVSALRSRRPLVIGGFDWLKTPKQDIQKMIDWPFEGLLFDVEENGLWWPEWGEKPRFASARRNTLAAVVAKAPKLIPLCGHRYLPETPAGAGNPVFSVYQADVICYGSNLANWIELEEKGLKVTQNEDRGNPKEIPFWSEVVRRNC